MICLLRGHVFNYYLAEKKKLLRGCERDFEEASKVFFFFLVKEGSQQSFFISNPEKSPL